MLILLDQIHLMDEAGNFRLSGVSDNCLQTGLLLVKLGSKDITNHCYN